MADTDTTAGTQAKKSKRRASKRRASPDAVVFYSYPKLIFIWPILAMGFVLWPLGGAGDTITKQVETTVTAPAQADAGGGGEQELTAAKQVVYRAHSPRLEVLGWLYLTAVIVVVLTIGVDVERNVAVFWLAVLVAFFFLGRWLADAKGFTLFGDIYRFFDALNVQYNRGFGLAVSVLLVIPYGVVLLWARIQNKWRITHNEFEHYSFGRADDSLARGAKRVRSTYPDLLELLLLGSGTLIVYSATGRSELRRIHHVPALPLLRRRINRILEQTAVTVTHEDAVHDEEAEAEAEEAASVEALGGDEDYRDGEKL